MSKFMPHMIGNKIMLCTMCTDEEAMNKYVSWLNDLSINKYLGRNSVLIQLTDEKKYLENISEINGPTWSIITRDDKLIGTCNINPDRGARAASVGILIGDNAELNKGFGTEAIGLMLWFGFMQMDLHEIHLGVFADNKRAIRCYEKNGFKICGTYKERYYVDGRFCDGHIMQILKSEWDSREDKIQPIF